MGQDRTGWDRTGQDRAEQCRIMKYCIIMGIKVLASTIVANQQVILFSRPVNVYDLHIYIHVHTIDLLVQCV